MHKIWQDLTYADRIRAFVALTLILTSCIALGATIYFMLQHKSCKIIKVVRKNKDNVPEKKSSDDETLLETNDENLMILPKSSDAVATVKRRRTIYDFPTLAIVVPWSQSTYLKCLGVFVHPSWVLTHGSCIFDHKDSQNIKFNLFLPKQENYHLGEPIGIEETILSPDSNLGLVHVKNSINASTIAELPKHSFQINPGGKGIVAGWHHKKFYSPIWSLYSPRLCALYFHVMTKYQEQSKTLFCAGDVYGLEQDCIGPISGPLFYHGRVVIGFHHIKTSHCSALHPEPLIYVKVSAYLNWFEEVIETNI